MDELHIKNYGDVIICPYDKTHVIPAGRIQRHLIKCEKQHQHLKYAICIFNTTHRVPQEELQNHQRNCPDRALIEVEKYTLENSQPALYSHLEAAMERMVWERTSMGVRDGPEQQDENWDDMDAPPYDPEEHCKNKAVIRKAVNMTRSERRKFRAEESIRLRPLYALEDEDKPK